MKKTLLTLFLTLALSISSLSVYATETENLSATETESAPTQTIPEALSIQESILSNSSYETPIESTYTESITEPSETESQKESLFSIDPIQNKADDAPPAVYENQGVYNYIARLYDIVLHRSHDEKGMSDWYNNLITGTNNGAQVAHGFFFSQEYQNENTSNDTYLRNLYQALFDREPDSTGYNEWMARLEAGVPRINILKGFVDSVEFDNLCKQFGITKGTIQVSQKGETIYYCDLFVRRLYQTVLEREADSSGLEMWKKLLVNQETTGAEIAYGFIFSEECLNKNLNDEAYIDLLYIAFFDRSSDASGKATWLNELKIGKSREYVFAGFVNSSEFNVLCNKYGIKQGFWNARGIDPNKPMIALTFDDGPSYYTPRILNCLEQYGQAATFFVVGYNAARYGSTMKRAYDMGCEIGNHSYNHPDLTNLSYNGIVNEITSTNNLILAATGANASICRTPGGSVNSTVRSAVGTPIIMWSIDTIDWKTRDTWSTVNIVLNNVRDGDIILMHDIHSPTIAAAEILIPELVARGYQLVTVSELAQYKGIQMQNGQVYSSFR